MGCCHSASKNGASIDRAQPALVKQREEDSGGDVDLHFDFNDCKQVERDVQRQEERRRSEEAARIAEKERMEQQRLAKLRAKEEDQQLSWAAHDEEMARERARIRAESEQTTAAADVLTL